ncbi:MAG: hypothetical protein M1418_06530 [Deltaproteobacteria bacterium]|nr:hypothetical protein [Deltaproteobacteria bacterium]
MSEPGLEFTLKKIDASQIDAGDALSFLSKRIYLTVLKFDCIIIDCTCQIDKRGLPFFLGSALRGAFGYSLKEQCCNHPDPLWRVALKECPKGCNCAYKTIFLSPAPLNLPPPYQGRTYKPHPFTLRAPWLSDIQRGRRFSFEITVIGEAHRAIAGFINGFALAGEKGIKTNRLRFNFSVNAVHQLHPDGSGQIVWNAGEEFFDKGLDYIYLYEFINDKTVEIFHSGMDIRLNSPLDLVIGRSTIRHLEQIQEALLVSRLASSLEELGVFWCGTPVLGGKPALRSTLCTLPIELENEWIYETRRLSVQEGNMMPLRGLMGTLRIRRPHQDTIRLLAAMLHIGIGQNKTFGFGRYDLYPI